MAYGPYQVGPYLITASLGRGDSTRFILDSGSQWSFLPNGLAKPYYQSFKSVRFQSDTLYFYDSVTSRVNFGHGATSDVIFSVAPGVGKSDNNLGLNFLSRFLVTLDLARLQVTFQPVAKEADDAGNAQMQLWMQKQGPKFLVAWVAPHSPAATAGVKIGDQALCVDSQSLASIPLPLVQELINRPSASQARLLIVRGTQTKRICYARCFSAKQRNLTAGVVFEFDGQHLWADVVTEGCRLYRQGLRAGDQVVSLNGRRLEALAAWQIYSQFGLPRLAGTFATANGRTKVFSLS